MYNLDLESVLIINSSTKTREEDFGLLVVSRTAPAMCLNQDAISVWNLCDGKRTLQEIINELTHDLPEEEKSVAENKIKNVVGQLLQFNLLMIKK